MVFVRRPRRRDLTRTFLAAALGVVACLVPGGEVHADPCPPLLGGPSEPPPDMVVDPPIDSAEACPNWRFVAIQRDATTPCPEPASAAGRSWQVEPLFAAADGDQGGLPPALRPFCLYRLDPSDAAFVDPLSKTLEDLVREGSLEAAASGCAAVSGMAQKPAQAADQATRASDPLWAHLEALFLAHAEPLPRVAPQEPAVRLAVLDTQSTGRLASPSRSDHGYALTGLLGRLLCVEGEDGAERCAARLAPRLALPIAEFSWADPAATTFDFEDGGYFGTIDQLARAVWDELEARRDDRRLILHLAVAWVGERFGGLEERVEEMPVPVQAVYRALEVASCRGALVVAAAGNRVGGPEPEGGPLLPAAWERRPAPSAKRCRQLLGDATRERGEHPREPLVYAAGGVHGSGASLVNARPDSEPPRVAYADHAVVLDGGGDKVRTPAILTGSSVATSVVAAAAAAVWHHRPELSRSEVMRLLEASGRSVGRRAALHLEGRAPEVRRVTVCGALVEACRGHCTFDISCSPRPLASGAPTLGEVVSGFDLSAFDASSPGRELCADEVLRFAGKAPRDRCPFRQYFSIWARPWTGPQPQDNPCLGCDIRPPPDQEGGLQDGGDTKTTASAGYVLRIQIDPDWSGGPLESATLVLGGESHALPLDPLEAGDRVFVTGLDLDAYEKSGADLAATLHFKTPDGSVESPVFIGR